MSFSGSEVCREVEDLQDAVVSLLELHSKGPAVQDFSRTVGTMTKSVGTWPRSSRSERSTPRGWTGSQTLRTPWTPRDTVLNDRPGAAAQDPVVLPTLADEPQRVRWRVADFARRKQETARGRPVRSPVFDACNVKGMQLLVFLNSNSTKLVTLGVDPPTPVTLLLLAPDTTHLRMRFVIGEDCSEWREVFPCAGDKARIYAALDGDEWMDHLDEDGGLTVGIDIDENYKKRKVKHCHRVMTSSSKPLPWAAQSYKDHFGKQMWSRKPPVYMGAGTAVDNRGNSNIVTPRHVIRGDGMGRV
mmetsp:Transcript_50312/g.132531  ORF Transcript_50312/g.132531 Transcript_50312/m.132531 type:complete len:301 (-) Transcript_50312:59-961(-)